jgi:hypothetical protein
MNWFSAPTSHCGARTQLDAASLTDLSGARCERYFRRLAGIIVFGQRIRLA